MQNYADHFVKLIRKIVCNTQFRNFLLRTMRVQRNIYEFRKKKTLDSRFNPFCHNYITSKKILVPVLIVSIIVLVLNI